MLTMTFPIPSFPVSLRNTFRKPTVKAKALYTYEPANADELPLEEGQVVDIVDSQEEEWWKAEKDGAVFVVPAAYLERLG